MKVTIIPEDSKIIVDGRVVEKDISSNEVHAIQWYGNSGEIEYKDGRRNEKFTDISKIQGYIDIFDAEVNKVDSMPDIDPWEDAIWDENTKTWGKTNKTNHEEIKLKVKKEKYYKEYTDFLDTGFEYNGVVYDCTESSIDDWAKLKIGIEDFPSDTIIQIRAKDNSMNNITVGDFLTLFKTALFNHVFTARKEYWAAVDRYIKKLE